MQLLGIHLIDKHFPYLFAYKMVPPNFQNYAKNLNPYNSFPSKTRPKNLNSSYLMDLDFRSVLEGKVHSVAECHKPSSELSCS